MSHEARRPRILVTRAEDVVGERWKDYADCVEAAGGDPVACDMADWQRDGVPAGYDGLLVTAGVDVDPARYGEERSPSVREIAPERDDFETALIEDALAAQRPILAICRGHQIFNVACGGSLHQHLEDREPHRARRGEGDAIDSGWHDVTFAPGTRLASIYGEGPLRANSRHHQAVTAGREAPSLTVAATTEDGVAEGLEHPDHPWAVSVQWHPERDEMQDSAPALFEAFVEACREQMASGD
jgi:putative glutamine amidotransferase